MKRAIASISLDLLLVMCQQSESPFATVTVNPLPDDAKIVGFNTRVFGDAETGPTTIDCIVESGSFADVPDDTPISDLPRLPLTRFRRVEQ
jgi:hypothetical protein